MATWLNKSEQVGGDKNLSIQSIGNSKEIYASRRRQEILKFNLLEAIESKTPVIYSDNGGAKELLDNGRNGLKIDINDSKKSSELILNYIEENDLHQKRITDSINFISKTFTLDQYELKLINLLKKY